MEDFPLFGWDPLESKSAADADVVTAAKKREIKNILKSYVSNYDPFSELIQNAMDAVERRLETDKNFKPEVKICIDLRMNSIEVVDNGCGFSPDQFKNFLAPSISYKSGFATRGNKGVGVTYIAYGFNTLYVKTKNADFDFSGELIGGRAWVEDTSSIVQRPLMKPSLDRSEWFEKIDQGSSFKIVFHGEHVRPSNLSWYQARSAEQWLYLLQVRTPLGYINLPDCSASRICFDLEVFDKDGLVTAAKSCPAVYMFPHTKISASPRLKSVIDAQLKAVTSGKDPVKAIDKFRQSNGLYETYSTQEILQFAKLSDEEKSLINQYSVTAYGYFAHSTEVWDSLNDNKAKLRKGLRILKGGLQLANNWMAQGELISIPLTKNIGHQNQAHVIVHFIGAEPDLGRKGFQPELKELAEQLATTIVKSLSARRDDILKSDSGAHIDIEKELKVHDWLKTLEEHEKNSPLILINDRFFLPTRRISITAVPQTEQDVIVLFNQLVAGGVIRGIRLLSTSQTSQYDGVFRYCAESPLEDYEYDKETNPLGVLQEQLTSAYVTKPKIIEYKYALDALVRDIENGDKQEADIQLAVFWEMGKEFRRNYTATSYLDLDHLHKRQHHGVTHRLASPTSGFDLICLKELIEYLNNQDEAQAQQKLLYDDE